MATSRKPTMLPYVRSTLPNIPGGERAWTDAELKKVGDSISTLISYIAYLEARIKALETP